MTHIKIGLVFVPIATTVFSFNGNSVDAITSGRTITFSLKDSPREYDALCSWMGRGMPIPLAAGPEQAFDVIEWHLGEKQENQ